MRKALLALALVGCSTIRPDTERLLNYRHAARVETPFGLGTGFPISDDSFLTAWHVVSQASPGAITVDGWVVLEVIKLEDLDAAVLVTGPHGLEPWTLADRSPRPGERVWKSGYAQGVHWWTEGIGTEDSYRVAIDIFPGDSGAPVFDSRGRVVGIVVMIGMAGRDHVLHHCWIVPMDKILSVLPPIEIEPLGPPAPLPAPETPWERFLRLREERLGY